MDQHDDSKIARRNDQRLDEDAHFPSDCAVAAAVCLKCISANSCAIRLGGGGVGGVWRRERKREGGTAVMGCHEETKESG